MPMVNIRKMGMTMAYKAVRMRMTMRLAAVPVERVLMLVVLVVRMSMRM